jgi:uncharacterized protein involved in exopolysaccharide biosynthesis
MTVPNPGSDDPHPAAELTLLPFLTFVLRHRRTVGAVALAGALVGLVAGLLRPRLYASEATFMPQASTEANLSSLAAAASQLGLRLPTQGTTWGAPVYVELLGSRPLLAPLILDTVAVEEEGGRRVPLLDLLEIDRGAPDERVDRGVMALRHLIETRELKSLNAVQVTVTTRWPSISQHIAQRLLAGLNQFNVETRKSQATAERQFVEARAADAESSLRQAEDRLQVFLQRNRSTAGSPELEFQRDRLQREVNLRQQLYTALLQSREEARVREVRDTPVITALEEPVVPTLPISRRIALKFVLGGLGGGILGLVAAWLTSGLRDERRAPNPEAREFFILLGQLVPRRLRGKATP